MPKFLIAGTLALLSASLLVSGAEAGASASAASKPTAASQVATAQQARANRQAQGFGITEFSSSSARTSSQKH